MKNKIDLIIVGAQKAGTTSLNNYLAQHPNIYTHKTLEFNMFRSLEDFNKGFQFYYNTTVEKKVKSEKNKNKFVAKRVGIMHDLNMMKQLQQYNPEVKIVVVLRNPIERAVSAFSYGRKTGREPLNDFTKALEQNTVNEDRFHGDIFRKQSCDYVGRSLYSKSIQDIYSLFPKENVSILLFEQMILDFNSYLNKIASTLGLQNYSFDTSKSYNEAGTSKNQVLAKIIAPGKFKSFKEIIPFQYRLKLKQFIKSKNTKKIDKIKIDDNTRKHLLELFKDDVFKLSEITDIPISTYWPEFF